MATAMHARMHATQLTWRANGQRAARHQERAQRPRTALNYHCAAVESTRHQGTGGNTGGQGGTPKGPEETTGGSEQATKPQ
jgi:hypothetical protein